MADGSVVFDVELDSSSLENALAKLDKNDAFLRKIDKVGYSIGSMIGTAIKGGIAVVGAAGAGAVALLRGSINAMKELEQGLGGSEAVFKEYASSVQASGKNAFKVLGLSQSDYLATANKMGSLFVGLGFEIGEATELATETMQRAADVASVMGIDVAWAMESIAGAAKGNFTMMDNLGVAVNDTAIANYALEKGIDASVEKMSTQEKVALAMQLFMERTAYAAGRYAEENNTLAGSFTTLGAAWENFLAGANETSVDDLVWSINNTVDVLTVKLQELIPRLGEELPKALEELTPTIKTLLQTILPSLTQMIVEILPPLASALGEAAKALAPALFDGLLAGILGEEGAAKAKEMLNSFLGIIPNKEAVNTRMMEAAAGVDPTSGKNVVPDTGFGPWDSLSEKVYENQKKQKQFLLNMLGIGTAGAEELPAEVSEANAQLASAMAADLDKALLEQFQNSEISYDQLVAAKFGSGTAADSATQGTSETGTGESTSLAQRMTADAVAGLQEAAPTLAQEMQTAIDSAESTADTSGFSDVGYQISAGIAAGIKSGESAVAKAVRDVIAAALAAAEKAAEINSPSRLFRDKVGASIAEGVAVGVEGNAYMVRKAVNAMMLDSLPDMRSVRSVASSLTYPYEIRRIVDAANAASFGALNQTNNFYVPYATPDEVANTMFEYATYGLAAER